MENPVLQIKDALIRVLKKIDPDTDVFFEEIKSTDPAHGVEQPKTWYFVDLKPGSLSLIHILWPRPRRIPGRCWS